MTKCTIRLAMQKDMTRWECFVRQSTQTSYVERWEWNQLIEEVYGIHPYRVIAEKDGEVVGLLALAHSQHPLLGNYLATAAYDSYGGIVAQDTDVRDELLNYAVKLREQLGAQYVLIRHKEGDAIPPSGWVQDPAYANFTLAIPADFQIYIRDVLRKKQRNQLKKSLEQGFQVRFGGQELLPEFWQVITRSMRELGSPYHRRDYLLHMLDLLGSDVEYAVVYSHEGHRVGGALTIYDRQTAYSYHANVLREYREQCAGDFLYWSLIQRCSRLGITCLDMGRSMVKSGNEHFKMKWLPQRKVMGCWYHLSPGRVLPHLNQANPNFRLAIRIWQRLPVVVTRFLSPFLIGGLL